MSKMLTFTAFFSLKRGAKVIAFFSIAIASGKKITLNLKIYTAISSN